jgi:hypothetical protein
MIKRLLLTRRAAEAKLELRKWVPFFNSASQAVAFPEGFLTQFFDYLKWHSEICSTASHILHDKKILLMLVCCSVVGPTDKNEGQ